MVAQAPREGGAQGDALGEGDALQDARHGAAEGIVAPRHAAPRGKAAKLAQRGPHPAVDEADAFQVASKGHAGKARGAQAKATRVVAARAKVAHARGPRALKDGLAAVMMLLRVIVTWTRVVVVVVTVLAVVLL